MVLKTVNQALRTISTLWRGSPEKWGSSYFYPLQPGTWQDLHYLDAFNNIPELNAIINLLARCHSNAVYKVVDKHGKEIENHWIGPLLRNPNWFQDQKEFIRQTVIFHELYGNEYIYNNVPLGFKAQRTKALFSLPPNLITPKLDEKDPFFTFSTTPNIKYILDFNGEKKTLDSENIIHLNDNQVNITKIDQKDILKGTSKCQALTPVLNNIKMAYESRGVIIKYRGAQGILSPESKDGIGQTIPFSDEEKEAAQHAYQSYGTLGRQFQLLITNVTSRFTPMTLNEPKKLGLFDECKLDFDRMLDSYQLPPDLFVRDQGATWENKNQARKEIYENNVIPSANERAGALNQKFLSDDKGKIIADFLHMPILQEDLKAKADMRNSNVNYLSRLLQDGMISPEEYREELYKIGIGDGKPIAKPEPTEQSNSNNNEQEEQTQE